MGAKRVISTLFAFQVQRQVGELLPPDGVPPQIPAATAGAAATAAARKPVRRQLGRAGGQEGALLHRRSRWGQIHQYT